MVVAQKVGGAHKNIILSQTTELSYLVEQNIKTLHTEKERYTEDLLHTYITYVCYICVFLTQNSIVCLLLR